MTVYTTRTLKRKLDVGDIFLGSVIPGKIKIVLGIAEVKTIFNIKPYFIIYAEEPKPTKGLFLDCYDESGNLCGFINVADIICISWILKIGISFIGLTIFLGILKNLLVLY